MKIRFIGPLGKVTGSCAWMRDDARGWNFLVDCGMQQGELTAGDWNACCWPFNPAELQFVVLTHAHIDHCGLIPMLYKRGFKGRVYCTRETSEIAKILLKDAVRIANVGYSAEDVDAVNWYEHWKGPVLGGVHPVDTDLFLRYYRSAHVIGAVSVAVYWGVPGPAQRSIVFSGDVGPNVEDDESLPFLRHRMGVVACDFAVVESTYGATVRPPCDDGPGLRREQLRRLLDDIIQRKGVLLIPAFSLGRTQDVLFDLHWIVAEDPDKYGAIDFRLDSPTAKKMNDAILKGLERSESNGRNGKVRSLWLGKQMFRWFDLDPTRSDDIERALDICRITLGASPQGGPGAASCGNGLASSWRPVFHPIERRETCTSSESPRPSVYVVSSGSCEGGPAAYWLPQLLPAGENVVALTGYCAPNSVGGQLLGLMTTSAKERGRHSGSITWPDGKSLPVAEIQADIAILSGYSAHADQSGLVDWVFNEYQGSKYEPAGRLVFIQHGTDQNRQALDRAIKARAEKCGLELSVVMPSDPGMEFDLDRGGDAINQEQRRRWLAKQIEKMRAELDAAAATDQANAPA